MLFHVLKQSVIEKKAWRKKSKKVIKMTRPMSLIMSQHRMNCRNYECQSYNDYQSYDENDLSIETIQALYNHQIMMLTKASAASQRKKISI